ncbi:MAG: hydrogen peroxide-inducible genes activator [Kofleriaceae bacterium]|nr:hydrogen peroxide-inducible genes activator [Candidatus Methylomirabilis lanthanidiphila]
MLTLRQLRYLDALARHRHFGRAAEACAVSQPALSMQIRELEQNLGVELVERRPGEILLTDAGREIARRGRTILSAVRDLADYARHRAQVLCGPLRLGVIPSLAPYLLPRLLPVLQARHPELRLELRETQTRLLIDELARGALDAAMVALPLHHPELRTLELFEDAFLLAAPAGEKMPKRGAISPEDIDPSRLILLEEGHCLRDQALSICPVSGDQTLKELGATSLTTVLQMVANGYGVTLLPEIAIATEARDRRVRIIPFAEPKPRRTIGLAWRRSSAREADFLALAKLVQQTVK